MKIAVIGGGISGYSTAIKLLESGKDVVIYSPEDASELATTNKACAIWMPFLLGELMTEDLKIDSLQSAMLSWQCFSELEKLPECGISRVTHTEITRQRDDRFAAHLYANFSEDSYIDSEQIYKYVHQYQTFVIEIPKYYKWLKKRFEYLGGESCTRFLHPEEIKKLPEKIIFNCTGLGARELVGDKLFQPKKGQIILHDPVDITCSLGVEELAIIPRSDALIIGTLYFTEDGLLENLAQTEKLWDLAEKWSNSEMGKKLGLNGKISRNKRLSGTSTLIGQRPCRDTGYELSAEIKQSHSIYNNYGHGGSGVTLSWGCATKVASLFQNNLNKKLQAINPHRTNKGVMQLSLELAHYELSYLVSLAPEELMEVIHKESRQLQAVISKLSLHRKNFSINILIDDKSSDVKDEARQSIVTQLSRLGADFICYESKLFDFIDVLNNKLNLPPKLKQEFKTYTTRHHKLGCSQDIFIWHCLRFGLIDHQTIFGAVIPCSKRAIAGDCHFAANGILNLLNKDFSPFEERADKYLLDCFGHEVPAAVKRYYI